MPLTLNDHIELREKLFHEEIPIKTATQIYWEGFREGDRSWRTKDWKERRAKFLKEKCEICNSDEKLIIQHQSHPKKYAEIKRGVIRKHTQIVRESNCKINKEDFKNYILKNYDYDAVPLCPSCGDNRPKKRVKKLPQYRCPECKLEFDKPVYKSLDELLSIFYEDEYGIDVRDKCFVTNNQWRQKNNLSNIKYFFIRTAVINNDSEVIEKESFLLYLNDVIKYLSFEDAITACKKCAYNEDINHMELCPVCENNYKGFQYPTCIDCLPEEKKNEARKMIDFGKRLRSINKQ